MIAALGMLIWLLGVMLLFVWFGTRLVVGEGRSWVGQGAGKYLWLVLFLSMIAGGYFLGRHI